MLWRESEGWTKTESNETTVQQQDSSAAGGCGSRVGICGLLCMAGEVLGTVCTVTLPPVEWQVRNEVSSPSHTYTCGELTAVDGKRRER